jgi:hypothetical protein
LNTVTASLDRKDFSKVQTSTLLSTMIQDFKFKPQDLQVKKLSTPTELLLTKKKENTPIRSRKKKLKKSTDNSFSQSQSTTESSSQPATNTSTSSVESEKKQKKITQKIEENLIEIGLENFF